MQISGHGTKRGRAESAHNDTVLSDLDVVPYGGSLDH